MVNPLRLKFSPVRPLYRQANSGVLSLLTGLSAWRNSEPSPKQCAWMHKLVLPFKIMIRCTTWTGCGHLPANDANTSYISSTSAYRSIFFFAALMRFLSCFSAALYRENKTEPRILPLLQHILNLKDLLPSTADVVLLVSFKPLASPLPPTHKRSSQFSLSPLFQGHFICNHVRGLSLAT